jgi:hypothetical protein
MIWNYIAGWWLTYPSEKCEVVSWDDDIPNIWETNVPNHQPDREFFFTVDIWINEASSENKSI